MARAWPALPPTPAAALACTAGWQATDDAAEALRLCRGAAGSALERLALRRAALLTAAAGLWLSGGVKRTEGWLAMASPSLRTAPPTLEERWAGVPAVLLAVSGDSVVLWRGAGADAVSALALHHVALPDTVREGEDALSPLVRFHGTGVGLAALRLGSRSDSIDDDEESLLPHEQESLARGGGGEATHASVQPRAAPGGGPSQPRRAVPSLRVMPPSSGSDPSLAPSGEGQGGAAASLGRPPLTGGRGGHATRPQASSDEERKDRDDEASGRGAALADGSREGLEARALTRRDVTRAPVVAAQDSSRSLVALSTFRPVPKRAEGSSTRAVVGGGRRGMQALRAGSSSSSIGAAITADGPTAARLVTQPVSARGSPTESRPRRPRPPLTPQNRLTAHASQPNLRARPQARGPAGKSSRGVSPPLTGVRAAAERTTPRVVGGHPDAGAGAGTAAEGNSVSLPTTGRKGWRRNGSSDLLEVSVGDDASEAGSKSSRRHRRQGSGAASKRSVSRSRSRGAARHHHRGAGAEGGASESTTAFASPLSLAMALTPLAMRRSDYGKAGGWLSARIGPDEAASLRASQRARSRAVARAGSTTASNPTSDPTGAGGQPGSSDPDGTGKLPAGSPAMTAGTHRSQDSSFPADDGPGTARSGLALGRIPETAQADALRDDPPPPRLAQESRRQSFVFRIASDSSSSGEDDSGAEGEGRAEPTSGLAVGAATAVGAESEAASGLDTRRTAAGGGTASGHTTEPSSARGRPMSLSRAGRSRSQTRTARRRKGSGGRWRPSKRRAAKGARPRGRTASPPGGGSAAPRLAARSAGNASPGSSQGAVGASGLEGMSEGGAAGGAGGRMSAGDAEDVDDDEGSSQDRDDGLGSLLSESLSAAGAASASAVLGAAAARLISGGRGKQAPASPREALRRLQACMEGAASTMSDLPALLPGTVALPVPGGTGDVADGSSSDSGADDVAFLDLRITRRLAAALLLAGVLAQRGVTGGDGESVVLAAAAGAVCADAASAAALAVAGAWSDRTRRMSLSVGGSDSVRDSVLASHAVSAASDDRQLAHSGSALGLASIQGNPRGVAGMNEAAGPALRAARAARAVIGPLAMIMSVTSPHHGADDDSSQGTGSRGILRGVSSVNDEEEAGEAGEGLAAWRAVGRGALEACLRAVAARQQSEDDGQAGGAGEDGEGTDDEQGPFGFGRDDERVVGRAAPEAGGPGLCPVWDVPSCGVPSAWTRELERALPAPQGVMDPLGPSLLQLAQAHTGHLSTSRVIPLSLARVLTAAAAAAAMAAPSFRTSQGDLGHGHEHCLAGASVALIGALTGLARSPTRSVSMVPEGDALARLALEVPRSLWGALPEAGTIPLLIAAAAAAMILPPPAAVSRSGLLPRHVASAAAALIGGVLLPAAEAPSVGERTRQAAARLVLGLGLGAAAGGVGAAGQGGTARTANGPPAGTPADGPESARLSTKGRSTSSAWLGGNGSVGRFGAAAAVIGGGGGLPSALLALTMTGGDAQAQLSPRRQPVISGSGAAVLVWMQRPARQGSSLVLLRSVRSEPAAASIARIGWLALCADIDEVIKTQLAEQRGRLAALGLVPSSGRFSPDGTAEDVEDEALALLMETPPPASSLLIPLALAPTTVSWFRLVLRAAVASSGPVMGHSSTPAECAASNALWTDLGAALDSCGAVAALACALDASSPWPQHLTSVQVEPHSAAMDPTPPTAARRPLVHASSHGRLGASPGKTGGRHQQEPTSPGKGGAGAAAAAFAGPGQPGTLGKARVSDGREVLGDMQLGAPSPTGHGRDVGAGSPAGAAGDEPPRPERIITMGGGGGATGGGGGESWDDSGGHGFGFGSDDDEDSMEMGDFLQDMHDELRSDFYATARQEAGVSGAGAEAPALGTLPEALRDKVMLGRPSAAVAGPSSVPSVLPSSGSAPGVTAAQSPHARGIGLSHGSSRGMVRVSAVPPSLAAAAVALGVSPAEAAARLEPYRVAALSPAAGSAAPAHDGAAAAHSTAALSLGSAVVAVADSWDGSAASLMPHGGARTAPPFVLRLRRFCDSDADARAFAVAALLLCLLQPSGLGWRDRFVMPFATDAAAQARAEDAARVAVVSAVERSVPDEVDGEAEATDGGDAAGAAKAAVSSLAGRLRKRLARVDTPVRLDGGGFGHSLARMDVNSGTATTNLASASSGDGDLPRAAAQAGGSGAPAGTFNPVFALQCALSVPGAADVAKAALRAIESLRPPPSVVVAVRRALRLLCPGFGFERGSWRLVDSVAKGAFARVSTARADGDGDALGLVASDEAELAALAASVRVPGSDAAPVVIKELSAPTSAQSRLPLASVLDEVAVLETAVLQRWTSTRTPAGTVLVGGRPLAPPPREGVVPLCVTRLLSFGCTSSAAEDGDRDPDLDMTSDVRPVHTDSDLALVAGPTGMPASARRLSPCWIVLERCERTAREWRDDTAAAAHPSPARRTAAVLRVFSSAALALAALHRNGVLHLDVKADNFLLRSDPAGALRDAALASLASAGGPGGTAGGEPYDPARDAHQLEVDAVVCAADLGEASAGAFGGGIPCGSCPKVPARSVAEALVGITSRARGAERIRAPEMIALDAGKGPSAPGSPSASSPSSSQDHADVPGASLTSAADVWGLGCMLVELVSGRYLYGEDEDDFPRFFLRLTAGSEGRAAPDGGVPVLVPWERLDRGLEGLPPSAVSGVQLLARTMLRRDPGLRSSAAEVSDHAAKLARQLERLG